MPHDEIQPVESNAEIGMQPNVAKVHYGTGKKLLAFLMPAWLVQWLTNNRTAVRLRTMWKRWYHRRRSHAEVYGDDYYEMIDATTGRSAAVMARSIVDHLNPKTSVDLGCGTGNLLEQLGNQGVSARGADFAPQALDLCRQRGLDVSRVDFTDPQAIAKPLGQFDLAICMEVAIQLPPVAAKNLIRSLCRHADTVLFSSPPCARDRLPKSPMTASQWIAEFASQDFELDQELSKTFKNEWRERGTAPWFYRKPMVFRSRLANNRNSQAKPGIL